MKLHLSNERCVACEGGVPPLSRSEAEGLLAEIPLWELADDGASISRQYSCGDFAEAITFINRVASLAESEGHHPDIHLTGYRNVRIVLSTHAINGLSRNDFILAAKIDA